MCTTQILEAGLIINGKYASGYVCIKVHLNASEFSSCKVVEMTFVELE